jgi:uracil-DNA glycosylase family protein
MNATHPVAEIAIHAPHPSAADYFPARTSLQSFRKAAAGCRGCSLYRRATQTVFGTGSASAKLMIVGEVPGDREDIEGKPFVGPAGRLLHKALMAAKIERKEIFLTNAVKHFKWRPQGTRRLHGKPSAREIAACRPWLEAEISIVEPRTIVCLGATAAQTLLGRSFRLTQHLGSPVESSWAQFVYATYHPSAILRAPTDQERHRMMELLVAHLKLAAAA